jgi:hypothetical protein
VLTVGRTALGGIAQALRRAPRVSPDVAWTGLAAAAAVALGLIATLATERALWIITGAGLGLVLLAFPTVLLWLTTWYALVGVGMLIYFAGLTEADWLLSAAAAPFWLIALTAPLAVRRGRAPAAGAPAFLWLIGLYLVLALGSSVMNAESVAQVLVGLKFYVLMFGVTLALFFADWDRRAMLKLCAGIVAIGLVQLPVALYQFVFIRSRRLEVGGRFAGDSEVEASDSVVGTMGGNPMAGGLSDLLALLLCALLAGVLALYLKRVITARRALLLSGALVFPLLITENKIIVVYFPLIAFIVAGGVMRRNPLKAAFGALAGVLLIPVVLWVYYQIHWSTQYPTFEEAVLRMSVYNIRPADGALKREGQLGRTEALEHWANHQSLGQIEHALFGHGLAAAKAGSRTVQSSLVQRHGGIQLNFTGLSTLLWEVGLVGTGVLLAALAAAFAAAGRLARSPRLEPAEQCVVQAAQVTVAMLPISLAYQNTLVSWGHASFAMFLALGLVAYYWRVAGSRPPG